jgi:metallopeptidase MepB
MATDTFRQPPQAPPLFTGTPASIAAAAHAAIAASRAAADAIVRDVTPDTATFATVLRPLAHAQSAATRERRVLGFYQDMAVDAAVRAASAEAERRMENHALEGAMREDVFRLVDAVFKKGEELDGEDRLYLEKRHARFLRNGLGLPAGAQRGRLKEIKERLTQLSNEFGKNLNERKGEVWFLPEELEGLPDDFVPELEKAVDGENSGKVRVDLTNPDSDKIWDRRPGARRVYDTRWLRRRCARTTFRYSKRRCFSGTRPLVYWDIRIMLRSGWRRKWPRIQRLSTISWRT